MESATSVIILTANRCALLAQTLEALAHGTLHPEEVIAVVSPSSDGTEALLEAWAGPFPLRRVAAPDAGAFAAARQAGLDAARGHCVAFLDDDCEPDRFWLERLTAPLRDGSLEAVGGMVLPANPLEAPTDYPPETCWAAGLLPEDFFGRLGGRLTIPSTSNLAALRSIFVEFPFQVQDGSLNQREGNYLFGREDAEWWRRVRRAGRSTGLAPRALVWHHIPEERLATERRLDRARQDGRAHWRRERPAGELPDAARTLAFAPVGFVQDLLGSPYPLAELWQRRRLEAVRAAALLEAARSDEEEPVPAHRIALHLLEGAGQAAGSLAKAGLRWLTAEGFRMASPRALPEHPPEDVLVVLHDLLGDTVLALPMLEELLAGLPEARVTVLAGAAGAPLLEDTLRPAHRRRLRILRVPGAARGRSPGAIVALARFLAPLRPDVVLLAYAHNLHPAPLFAVHGAPVIAWQEDNGTQQRLWGDLVTALVPKTFRKAEVAALQDLLRPLGLRPRLRRPRVRVGRRAAARVERLLTEAGAPRRYVVFHAEAAQRDKFWPAQHWERLVELMQDEEADTAVFLVGGQESRPWGRAVAQRAGGGVHALHGALAGNELAALLAGAACFVGADSGPSHVAQAVGARCILLFGSTEPHRWGPLPTLVGEAEPEFTGLLGGPGDWLAAERAGLEPDHWLRLLTPEAVFGHLQAALSGLESGHFRATPAPDEKTAGDEETH